MVDVLGRLLELGAQPGRWNGERLYAGQPHSGKRGVEKRRRANKAARAARKANRP